MRSFSTLAFKVVKSLLAAKSDVSTSVAWSNSFFVALFDKSNTISILSLIWLVLDNNLFIIYSATIICYNFLFFFFV